MDFTIQSHTGFLTRHFGLIISKLEIIRSLLLGEKCENIVIQQAKIYDQIDVDFTGLYTGCSRVTFGPSIIKIEGPSHHNFGEKNFWEHVMSQTEYSRDYFQLNFIFIGPLVWIFQVFLVR